MSAPDDQLRRRYRRLLFTYPRTFRERHGEELLSVMLDGAGAGQRFPRPREAADLFAHGLATRVRERSAVSQVPAVPGGDVTWGNALATSSVHGLGPAPVGSWTVPRWLKWLTALVGVAVLPALVYSLVGFPAPFYHHALAGYTGTGFATGSVGQPTYHGLAVMPASGRPTAVTLDITALAPRIAVNTADATVAVEVCAGTYAGALVVSGASQGLAHDCARLSRFHPTSLRLGTDLDTGSPTTTGVVVVVTPHRSGVVRIEGADVTYRDGIWHRHQHVGTDWTLHVP